MPYDAESGLYHTWFRQYDPNQARWMAVDPLSGSLGNSQSLNRYTYVNNMPVSSIDPSGLGCSAAKVPAACGEGDAVINGGGSLCILDGVETACIFVTQTVNQGAAQVCLDAACNLSADLEPTLAGVNIVLNLGSGVAVPAYPCPGGECKTSPPWAEVYSVVLGGLPFPIRPQCPQTRAARAPVAGFRRRTHRPMRLPRP